MESLNTFWQSLTAIDYGMIVLVVMIFEHCIKPIIKKIFKRTTDYPMLVLGTAYIAAWVYGFNERWAWQDGFAYAHSHALFYGIGAILGYRVVYERIVQGMVKRKKNEV